MVNKDNCLIRKIVMLITLFLLMNVFYFINNSNTYSIDETISRFGEAIYIDNNDSIDLVDENIYIDVPTGDVTCLYGLKNNTGVSKDITLKFPGKITYKVNALEKQIDIKKLAIYVDNQKVDASKENFLKSEYDYWYVWNVNFASGETHNILLAYECIWEKDYLDGISVGFIRTKGGPWKKDLGYSKITFDFGNLSDYYLINSLDNGIYKIVDNKYIWEAKEYVPNEDLVFYMRPKLLDSKTLNVSYYENTKALINRKVLIDIDINNTNTQEEKEVKEKASSFLKEKLELSGAEACISSELEHYLNKYNGQCKFDYIITLICDKSNNAEKYKAYIGFEQVERDNEEKYRRSYEIVQNIANCGLDGISNVFSNIKENYGDGETNEPLLENRGVLEIEEAFDYTVPRTIISLGYVSDYAKRYENYEDIVSKIRLGLSIYEETLKNGELENELKESESLYQKRQEEKKKEKASELVTFFKYNIWTILICLMVGAGIGIGIFMIIIANEQRKNRERYAKWYKKIK